MAKDRRNKVRPKLDLENEVATNQSRRSAEPSRATAKTPSKATASTRAKASKKKKTKKKKLSRAALIVRCVFAVLIVALLVTIGIAAYRICSELFFIDDEVVKNPPIASNEYDVTPVDDQSKVAYYLLGVLGEESDDKTTMLSVICHDKQKNTANVLQLPQATYIEEADTWEVDTIGAVFANPKPLDWCQLCGKRLYAPEITEGEVATHNVCGTQVTTKKGSAVAGLVDFVNDQLSLPVDEYFMLPQGAVTVLVDSVGGVDVELSSAYTLADQNYESGVQTLSGAAALEYICDSEVGETTRLIRQREVFGALLTRMLRMEEEALEEDVIEEVMDSSSAIRTDCTASEITDVVLSFKNAGVTGVTVQFLPGETTVDGDGDTVYSAHKDELLTLLNASFNPYGAAITETDLLIPELVDSGEADTVTATLDTYVPDQVGTILDTSME